MKIRENIFDSINKMDANELAFIYEHIRFMEKRKRVPAEKKQIFSINQILDMTGSSESRWSETVSEQREDRI